MRVTRLEVFGFKSFMERLVLPLEGGITGVVGPNGCGKSNIVDALRWVLGETRASNLRGELLEDVIFNGTDKLRPLGLAEVTITLRATLDNFFDDLLAPNRLGEILSKNSPTENSEELENVDTETPEGEAPRLRVIQGGANEPVTLTTDVEVSEEELSSAVSGEVSPALLARFSWLKQATEVQITRRLYRSGESEFFINRVACKLKDIKDLLRAVGLGPRSYTIVAQGEVGRIISARPEDRRAIIEEAAGVLGIKERVAAAKRRLEETGTNLSRINDIVSEVTRQVASLKRQAARAEARAEIKARIFVLDRTLYAERLLDLKARLASLEQSHAALTQALATAEADLTTARVTEEAIRAKSFELDIKGDELRLEIDQIREALSSRQQNRLEKQSRVKELKSASVMKRDEGKRHEERAGQLTQRHEQLRSEVTQLSATVTQLTAELEGAEKHNESDLRQSAENLARSREALRAKESELRHVREKMVAQRSSKEEVERQIIALSPLTELQRTLGQKGSSVIDQIRERTRPLADGMRVPARFARAMQALLAEQAAFLVGENPFEVARLFSSEASRLNRPGIGLGIFRAGISAETIPATYVGLPSLASFVELQNNVQSAATKLLRNVAVAETLAEALTVFESHTGDETADLKIVTLEGEIVSRDSFYLFKHEGGVLQLKSRLDELTHVLALSDHQVATLTAEREALQQSVSSNEEQNRQAIKTSQERQARVRQIVNDLGSARGRRDASERMLQQSLSDATRAKELVSECIKRAEQCEADAIIAEQELATLNTEQDLVEQERLKVLQHNYGELEALRRSQREELSSAARTLAESQRNAEKLRQGTNDHALEQQKIALEEGNILDRLHSEYPPEMRQEIDQLVLSGTRVDADAREVLHDELEKLKARVIREGEVDPTTIEQYKLEEQRLTELTQSRDDLAKAVETLQSTVKSLEAASVTRFLETFYAIQRNYSLLVPRLFGGGKGELLLTDPDNPLQSGVEIVVRPPGKKPKSIELLSGGEKALCATALIFSMFLVRPSPLCVLDEVDAPLDEANLVRLLTLIKEMSQRTQFLVITHNKQSMSTADNLVGVTMQEPGATRIITVSLQDAYRAVG